MKKSIIITAIALGLSFATLNATTTVANSNVLEVVKQKQSVSPFCMSIVKGDVETVKKLIELGADVDQISNGMTPSMYAAKYNKVEILKLLVDNGANLDIKSDKGLKAEKYAKQSNAKDALAYLKELES